MKSRALDLYCNCSLNLPAARGLSERLRWKSLLLVRPVILVVLFHERMEMIRAYVDTDWEQVREIYDLSKPDELKNIVDADTITPLSKDDQMLPYFNESEIMVYEEEVNILGFIGRKGNVVSWLFVHPDHRRKGIGRRLLKDLIRTWKGPLRRLIEINCST